MIVTNNCAKVAISNFVKSSVPDDLIFRILLPPVTSSFSHGIVFCCSKCELLISLQELIYQCQIFQASMSY
jgi:hypothetical protein